MSHKSSLPIFFFSLVRSAAPEENDSIGIYGQYYLRFPCVFGAYYALYGLISMVAIWMEISKGITLISTFNIGYNVEYHQKITINDSTFSYHFNYITIIVVYRYTKCRRRSACSFVLFFFCWNFFTIWSKQNIAYCRRSIMQTGKQRVEKLGWPTPNKTYTAHTLRWTDNKRCG